jgi:uncharacterized repeat protein (TIGR01451 family)
MHIVRVITAAVLVLTAGTIAAQGNPIVVKNVAETEVSVKNAQGAVERKRVPVERAVPGTEVIYTTTFTNNGAKPAGNVAVTNPVPADTTYVAGSAVGDNTDVTYSVDGGKTYQPADKLRVRTADGKERAATAADYTHIRWAYRGELAPGKTGTASFRAVIK